jgi:Tol biopolymer transport system component
MENYVVRNNFSIPKQQLLVLLAALLFPFFSNAQFYNGSQTDFGQNRVQYQDFKWNYYKFPKYEVYYNTGGKEMAIWVARTAKTEIADIEKFFDYTIEDKIQFIVYNKQEDFKQSNVGLTTDDGSNVGGVTHIVGRKVFLYYENDHVALREQIRAGIAEVLINQMMYGGNMRDMVKNSTLLNLPEWYTKGLISYVAKGWNSETDNRVRDGIVSGRYKKFNHLTGQEADYAGQSIWYYIAEKYSPAVIPNILYMTKVSRNVESSFLFVLGVNMHVLTLEWMNYYQEKYSFNDTTRVLPQTSPFVSKPKSTKVYSDAKISPDGHYMTYVTNEMGQIKLWMEDLQTGKKKRLFKMGQKLDRINDYSYPLIAWHPSGKILSYIYEKKGETWLVVYDVEDETKVVKPIYNFIKILDYSYSPDGKSFVMSAVQNGQTDIYLYNIGGGSAIPITKDIYDDLNPRFVDNGKSIIFSSNRTSDTLNVKVNPDTKLVTSFDLFVYNVQTRSQVLRRLTNTPGIDELQAQAWDSTHFSFISDQNGIFNRYVGYFDSTISYIDTAAHYKYLSRSIAVSNFKYGIIEQDISPGANKLTEIIFHDGKYWIYTETLIPFESLGSAKLKNTAHRDRMIELAKVDEELEAEKNKKESPPIPNGKPMETIKVYDTPEDRDKAKSDSTKVDINNYQFDGTGNQHKNSPPPVVVYHPDTVMHDTIVKAPVDEFILPIARNYKVQFKTDYIVSQLDNSFLNAGYQRFTGGGSPIYLNPGFTGLLKIGMIDLLEDHKIVGGVRLSSDLKSNEYVLSYEDRTRRWDKTIMLHRQAFLNVTSTGVRTKVYTHEARYGLKYPFNEVLSARGTLGYRNDQQIILATDYPGLLAKNSYTNAINGKLELVFDNSIKMGLNLWKGIRFKVYAETFQGMDSLVNAKIASNHRMKNDLYDVGFDFRYSLRIHREIVWCNRVAAGTSFGHEKLVYYMGGVDNWLTPKFDQSVRVADDQNYTYQTLVEPMRGFWQNARNGNSFAVVNSELRVPVIRYLFNRPLRSDFFNNFQLIGFGDLGTAWTGKSPYDPENSLNTTIVSAAGNPIMVILKNHSDPIIGGYGFGARTRLWGYFVRVDWSWGVENKKVLPRQTYISFSLDF